MRLATLLLGALLLTGCATDSDLDHQFNLDNPRPTQDDCAADPTCAREMLNDGSDDLHS